MLRTVLGHNGFVLATLYTSGDLRRDEDGNFNDKFDVVIEAPHAAATDEMWNALTAGLLAHHVEETLLHGLYYLHSVNADVGSGKIALEVAEKMGELRPALRIAVLVCHLPRSVVDTNRLGAAAGLTPPFPPSIDGEARQWLEALHTAYMGEADRVWSNLSPNGCGFCSHTYAPWGVAPKEGETAEAAVRRFYGDPDTMKSTSKRSEVDIIWQRPVDMEQLAPPKALRRVEDSLRQVIPGKITKNEEFTMNPAVVADRRAVDHPGQVVCLEVRRDLLTKWTPGQEMAPDPNTCKIIGHAIAAALTACYFP